MQKKTRDTLEEKRRMEEKLEGEERVFLGEMGKYIHKLGGGNWESFLKNFTAHMIPLRSCSQASVVLQVCRTCICFYCAKRQNRERLLYRFVV